MRKWLAPTFAVIYLMVLAACESGAIPKVSGTPYRTAATEIATNTAFARDEATASAPVPLFLNQKYLSENGWVYYSPWVTANIPSVGQITRIRIAKNGTAWFATKNGVVSFDGKAWKLYALGDAIKGSQVNDIEVDTRNKVWVATTSGGISYFDGANWRAQLLVGAEQDLGTVTAIAVSAEGVLWGGWSDGIFRFDGLKWVSVSVNGVNSPCAQDGCHVWVNAPVPASVAPARR